MGRRKTSRRWLWRALALLALFACGAGGWLWWDTRHWTPSEADYPDQGGLVGAAQGAVSFTGLKALGAHFVYLRASSGASGEDSSFVANLSAAREAGLQAGAVHEFDPCIAADGQSANFVTMVPRGEGLLPPVISLDRIAENCPTRVGDAAVESELMTLINQIENHSAQPVILRLSPGFEAQYRISARLDRNLWLIRTRLAPSYAQRPWLMWSANLDLMSEASENPIEWVVVQP